MPSSGRKRGAERTALQILRRAVLWAGIAVVTLVVVILATSTWQRHRPANAEPVASAADDEFCVDVLNGNRRRGEARTVASHLRGRGFRVEDIANAERFDYPRTLVIDRSGIPGRARAVAQALGGVPIVLQRGHEVGCEVTVVLGHDWSLDPAWEERQEEWD